MIQLKFFMDSYTKIVLTIIAFSTSVLALTELLKDKTIELQQNNQLQRITLCTASGLWCRNPFQCTFYNR